jgi:uncharacterized protein (DUF433 family)
MIELPSSPHVEVRDAAYFLAGTRISLGSIACAVGRGETVDEILGDFPVIKSRSGLEGAVAFIKAHPHEIEAYLADLDSRWENARKMNPPGVVERARRFRSENALKSA